jgi:threonine dehydrogenase-like Zn-dependent dehydrogenase
MALRRCPWSRLNMCPLIEFRETLDAIAIGRFGPLDWIEEWALADGPKAFRDLDAGATGAAKIVLRP